MPSRGGTLFWLLPALALALLLLVVQINAWLFLHAEVVGMEAEEWVKLRKGDLSFYLQANQVSNRLEFAIQSARRIFPEAPFYLLSDGGPSFQPLAAKWNISAFHSPKRIHHGVYFGTNFTCREYLLRITDAARWAQSRGAKYLMLLEDDTRVLRPPKKFPKSADVVGMGNGAQRHAGAFTPEAVSKLFQKKPSELEPGDLRRMRLSREYASRDGYSTGPASSWRIQSLIKAFEGSPPSELDDMYAVSDMCQEDFAVARGLVVRRSAEIQEIVWRFGDFDMRSEGTDPSQNFWCMSCLDGCKTKCNCAPPWNLKDKLWYMIYQLLSFFDPGHFAQKRTELLWARPCHACDAGIEGTASCWDSCKADCIELCPAVIHPHKGTTLDCEEVQPQPAQSYEKNEFPTKSIHIVWMDTFQFIDTILNLKTFESNRIILMTNGTIDSGSTTRKYTCKLKFRK